MPKVCGNVNIHQSYFLAGICFPLPSSRTSGEALFWKAKYSDLPALSQTFEKLYSVAQRELKARFNDGCVGIAVGDRLRACGSHRYQVVYPHEGMSRLRKRSGGGHMSWMRGKRCSSKGGIAWSFIGTRQRSFRRFKPSTEALKRLTLSSNPICRVDSLQCYEWPVYLASS
jgi:hypothetical protein